MENQEGITPAAAHARAWLLYNDPEIKRLRRRLDKHEAEMKRAELRIPEDVRDLETLELHLAGETTGEVKEAMEHFLQTCPSLFEYSRMLLRKALLERLIAGCLASRMRKGRLVD